MFHLDTDKTLFLKDLLKTLGSKDYEDMSAKLAKDLHFDFDEFNRIADEIYELLEPKFD